MILKLNVLWKLRWSVQERIWTCTRDCLFQLCWIKRGPTALRVLLRKDWCTVRRTVSCRLHWHQRVKVGGWSKDHPWSFVDGHHCPYPSVSVSMDVTVAVTIHGQTPPCIPLCHSVHRCHSSCDHQGTHCLFMSIYQMYINVTFNQNMCTIKVSEPWNEVIWAVWIQSQWAAYNEWSLNVNKEASGTCCPQHNNIVAPSMLLSGSFGVIGRWVCWVTPSFLLSTVCTLCKVCCSIGTPSENLVQGCLMLRAYGKCLTDRKTSPLPQCGPPSHTALSKDPFQYHHSRTRCHLKWPF